MSYTYSETFRSKNLHTEVLVSADKTATTIQTPKTYALACAAAINDEVVSTFESKQYVADSADSATGFVIDGTCDVDLILRYTGTNKQIAETFNLEMRDTSCASVDDFKLYVSGMLLNYYPTVQLSQLKIKTAVFKFHE